MGYNSTKGFTIKIKTCIITLETGFTQPKNLWRLRLWI